MKGILYGVSVGPGDPELMTMKAVRTISACPVIATPRTAGGKTLALDIARGAVDLAGKKILTLSFPMAKDPQILKDNYETQAKRLEDILSQGKDIAMLNLGDVSVYSTFSQLMAPLRRDGYETRMIPGVASFCAVAARLDTSLTEPSRPLHIFPAGGIALEEALAMPGTKVLMKSGRQLAAVCEALAKAGKADCSMMVRDCGLPTEKIFRRMDLVEPDSSYFTTILVKDETI